VKGVVIACAGPSLGSVDPWSAGWPVCAVSTAIRHIPRPTWWATLDGLQASHGPEGCDACASGEVQVLVPTYKRVPTKGMIQVPYARRTIEDAGREPFDGRLPLMRSRHLSVLFALQWLAREGHDLIIFAGCELAAAREKPYVYGRAIPKTNFDHLRTICTSLYHVFEKWTPMAAEAGIRLVDWSGGRLGTLMEAYDAEAHSARAQ
jgi:hypothetical protein